jgi:hypothetical protein
MKTKTLLIIAISIVALSIVAIMLKNSSTNHILKFQKGTKSGKEIRKAIIEKHNSSYKTILNRLRYARYKVKQRRDETSLDHNRILTVVYDKPWNPKNVKRSKKIIMKSLKFEPETDPTDGTMSWTHSKYIVEMNATDDNLIFLKFKIKTAN